MAMLEDVYKKLQEQMPPSTAEVMLISAVGTVLWRQLPAAALQVFLVKRAATMAFLSGFWTFPGGKLTATDGSPEQGACRLLLEETGIRVRHATLMPAGRWRMPSVPPLCFDAQFFFAQLPSHQEPEFQGSAGEMVEGNWWSVPDAIEAFAQGRLLLPTSVVRVLRALVPGMAGVSERANEEARLEEKAPRLWELAGGIAVSPLRTPTLPPATHTNCYVIGTGDLIVIDPATYEDGEREVLCAGLDQAIASGRKVVAVWLTHHHGDHIGSAEYIAARYSAPICAHQASAQKLAGICRVDELLVDGECRHLAGPLPRELVCIFTPGHAPGHLCFYERNTASLIAGDMVASVGTILIDPSEGDMSAYLQSLDRMKSLDARLLLPAHGMAIADPSRLLDQYRAHRLGREAQILAALGPEPRSAQDLVRQVYVDTPLVLHGLAERSLLAHLHKLCADGTAIRAHDTWASAP